MKTLTVIISISSLLCASVALSQPKDNQKTNMQFSATYVHSANTALISDAQCKKLLPMQQNAIEEKQANITTAISLANSKIVDLNSLQDLKHKRVLDNGSASVNTQAGTWKFKLNGHSVETPISFVTFSAKNDTVNKNTFILQSLYCTAEIATKS